MALTQHDAIIKALRARGEKETILPNVTKWLIFTRHWWGLRDASGSLLIARQGGYWFVGKESGAMRIGRTSGTSRSVAGASKNALVAEGRALP